MKTHQSSSLATETEVARELYAAINRGDIPAAIELCDPKIERIEPEGFPSAGTYRGHSNVKAHLARGRQTWAEGSCEPEEFIIAGDKVVVLLSVRVRLKDELKWIEGRFAAVLTFRNGKIIEMRTFAQRSQAIE